MKLDEVKITQAILESYVDEFLDSLESEVAIVGGGPAGLTAAYYLAEAGIDTVVFERKLSVGGGMWGGGMMFNKIVVQEKGREILEDFEINSYRYDEGYYTADSVESVGALSSQAVKAGANIFNLIHVEDVTIKNGVLEGLVLLWNPVRLADLEIDPLAISTEKVIDATGHDCEVVKTLEEKNDLRLNTEEGKSMGEKSMWAEVSEKNVVKNTKEVFPNLYVAGMAANAVYGIPRMGPIFGGMLLSGKKAAQSIIEDLR